MVRSSPERANAWRASLPHAARLRYHTTCLPLFFCRNLRPFLTLLTRYVRARSGTLTAISQRAFCRADYSPLPASPSRLSYAPPLTLTLLHATSAYYGLARLCRALRTRRARAVAPAATQWGQHLLLNSRLLAAVDAGRTDHDARACYGDALEI